MRQIRRLTSLMASTALAFGTLSTAAYADEQVVKTAGDAQTAPSDKAPPAPMAAPTAKSATDVQSVLVTGSRIRRKEVESSSPMEVITRDDAELGGVTDVAEALQTSNLASGVQSNSQLSGYVVTGGSGVHSFDLHGVGADRTLVLLNGRRLGPAGVGGTVGPVDLNVIPQAVWDSVEILKDGASSVYGSDAISGVANIITRNRFDGLELNASGDTAARQGGGSSLIDAFIGKVSEKGYINASISYARQEALRQSQRSYLSCASSYVFDPTTGARADVLGTNGSPKCFNLLNNSFQSYGYGGVFQWDPSASNYDYPADALGLRGVLPNWVRAGRASHPDTYPYENTTSALSDAATAVSPSSNGTFFLQGGYNITPKIEAYTEILLTERRSSQFGAAQFFPWIDPANPENTVASGFQAVGGLGYVRPIIAYPIRTAQVVDYSRFVGGFKGGFSVGMLQNWDYDVYTTFSNNSGYYSQNFIYGDRVNATTGPGVACDPTQITISGGSQCPTIPWLDPRILAGNFNAEEQAFLFGRETGHTIYDQSSIVAEANGDLFDLPAGKVAASVGASYRRDSINDRPGYNAQNYNYWGYSTAGVTRGSDSVDEVYGEIEAPLLRGQPFVDKLDLNVSGRYVDYRSSGSYGIYKVGLYWQITPEFKLRATHGTSIRAPALYEQFLANQTSYVNIVDPCTLWGDSTNAKLRANCAAAGIPATYGGALASAEVLQGGGANLKAESSKESTAGIVLTPKFANLSIAVDWTQLTVTNELANYGAQNIVNACYDSRFSYPNAFCTYFTRDATSHDVVLINDNFENIQTESYAGIDLTVKYRSAPLSFKGMEVGRLSVNAYATWNTTNRQQLVAQFSQNNLGLINYPQFVSDIEANIKRGDQTFYWRVDMIGRSSDVSIDGGPTQTYGPTGALVNYKYYVNSILYHRVSWEIKKHAWKFEAGVINLFDQHPPALSSGEFRVGVSALNGYDPIGRRFFASIQRKF